MGKTYQFHRSVQPLDYNSLDNRFYYHILRAEDSGSIITARGPGSYLGRLPHGTMIYVLPPIDEFGEGMEFTFRPGPLTEFNIYAHQGLRPPFSAPFTNEWEVKGYTSHDYYSNEASTGVWGEGSGQDYYGGSYFAPAYNDQAGSSNGGITFTSIRRESNSRGGIWIITQDEDSISIHPYYWTPIALFDWYNIRQRYPANDPINDIVDGIDYNDDDQVGSVIRPLVSKTFFTFQNPDNSVLTKPHDYTVTVADNGAIITNTGALHDVVYTLPSAQPGLAYTFLKSNGNSVGNLHIRAQEGNYIQIFEFNRFNEHAREIYQNSINANIQLFAADNRNWHYYHQIPEWFAVHGTLEERYYNTTHASGTNGTILSDRTVLEDEDGSVFVSSGNFGDIKYTLPAVYEELEYTFVVGTSQSGTFKTTVSGQPGQKFFLPGSPTIDGYDQVESNAYCDTLRIKGFGPHTGWWPVLVSGNWIGS